MASDATKSHIFQQLFSIKILTKLRIKQHHSLGLAARITFFSNIPIYSRYFLNTYNILST